MGVPKFYRWTSERYPCLSQVVKDYQIPEFDCLYLDMNGIIHVCSHPNDNDPHFRIKEEEIFANIFHYIEILFRIIKPQQHFFMAVDGVAPRAKMNQQRGRRFRTAREAEDNVRKALSKGQVLPADEQFDSNCITPGTEFMVRLQDQLKYFVNMKISTDPLWQKCTVHLSGHNVPGEGEHKIMDFIRYQKSQENYNPNTRHCLYGLDADLVMLGLSCHEPHFALLREEVRFGKQSKRTQKAEETTFHLLHLSLLREYLDMEFSDLKDKLPFGYDMERIIDDWILMGFLVGNDFVPHLPNLHIDAEALPYLYKVYKDVLPTLDGYLHDGGVLNLPRFLAFINGLSKLDEEKFEDTFCDLKWLESKSSSPKRGASTPHAKKYPALDPNDSLLSSSKMALVTELYDGNDTALTADAESTFGEEFELNKTQYYAEKFNLDVIQEETVRDIASEYLRAIQWILHYYFNGCQSWSWYYPHHYAPYISDLKKCVGVSLEYDPSTPFHPFEQLLAVLPAASKKLLPPAFQTLMVTQSSPIIEYYPLDFKTDLNGKRQDWEAVVLVPFIDEKQLLDAMTAQLPYLTQDERDRNSFGEGLTYSYSPDVSYKLSSSYPGVFRDIDTCHAVCETVHRDAYRIDQNLIKKGLCPDVEMRTYFCGFPTMSHVKYTSTFSAAGVKIFQQNSRKDNAIVTIKGSNFEAENVEVCSKQLLGKTVYVEWPYLVEAKVVSVFDQSAKYKLNDAGEVEKVGLSQKMEDEYKQQLHWVKSFHKERKGIIVGDVSILVEAKPIKGKRYVYASKGTLKLEKQWSAAPMVYPSNMLVENLQQLSDSTDRQICSISDLFPIGSECFMMASPHYGCSGEVLEVDQNAGRVRVSLNVGAEPDLSFLQNTSKNSDVQYFPSNSVARKLGISPYLLSRITGSIFVESENSAGGSASTQNIGLRLKFSGKNREVLGYARRTEQGWMYSDTATTVLQEYMERYPQIAQTVAGAPKQDRYLPHEFKFDKPSAEALKEIASWLESLPCSKLSLTPCGSESVGQPGIDKIMEAVDACKGTAPNSVRVKVKPRALFKHDTEFGSLEPDPKADYRMLDRVVNVRHSNAVPLGLRGTVIGSVKDDSAGDTKQQGCPLTYEVLFDDTFLGGLKGRCSVARTQYLSSNAFLNISYGLRSSKLTNPAESCTQSPKTLPLKSSWAQQQASPKHSSPSQETDGPKQETPRRGQRHTQQTPTQANVNDNFQKMWNDLQLNKRTQHTQQHTPILQSKSNLSPMQEKQVSSVPSQSHHSMKKSPVVTTPGSTPQSDSKVDKEGSAALRSLLEIGGSHAAHGAMTSASPPSFRPPRPVLRGPAAFAASLEVHPTVASPVMAPQFADVPLSPGGIESGASAALQVLCYQLALPMPQYIYSSTGQGVHAVVLIGPLLRFGGTICMDRHQAAESAAMFALGTLQAPPQPVVSHTGVYAFGQQQPLLPFQPVPGFPVGFPQPQPPTSTPPHPAVSPREPRTERASGNFVPHQVVLKKRQMPPAAAAATEPSPESHTPQPKDKGRQAVSSVSTQPSSGVTPSSSATPVSSSTAGRKQRLLAPSFFGAKK